MRHLLGSLDQIYVVLETDDGARILPASQTVSYFACGGTIHCAGSLDKAEQLQKSIELNRSVNLGTSYHLEQHHIALIGSIVY